MATKLVCEDRWGWYPGSQSGILDWVCLSGIQDQIFQHQSFLSSRMISEKKLSASSLLILKSFWNFELCILYGRKTRARVLRFSKLPPSLNTFEAWFVGWVFWASNYILILVSFFRSKSCGFFRSCLGTDSFLSTKPLRAPLREFGTLFWYLWKSLLFG